VAKRGSTKVDPRKALIRDYVQRRGLSISELERRTGRSRRAIAKYLNGQSQGEKPWQEESMFVLLIDVLKIPRKELLEAESERSADRLLQALRSSNARNRPSKTWYTQTAAEQRELAFAAAS